ncbi:MAG: hypothetical protein FWG83_03385 [Oscillospiraceae bacterium]|nr:hypothetical protein [Oscillospiraceae bacterium]
MRLTEWITVGREENEALDIVLQVVRLLRETGEGRGMISPALYEVDFANNVTFVGNDNPIRYSEEFAELHESFRAPETAAHSLNSSNNSNSTNNSGDSSPAEKRDIFSLGLLMYYLLNREICSVDRQTSAFGNIFSRGWKKNTAPSAAMAEDSGVISVLMERMTAYNPESRPLLKEVLTVLGTNICKFGIVPVNVLTGERYAPINRSFAGNEVYKFTPEKEYVFNAATITPLSCQPMLIPFRLVQKQYILDVAYGAEGRWVHSEKSGNSENSSDKPPEESEAAVDKATAALYFCDNVYGLKGDSLFCETDGYTYEMGFYEYLRKDENKRISIVREGSIAVPERLEARILSILRERSKTINDLFCVAVYGNLNSQVIKAVNDMLPEAIHIYRLDDEALLKGARLYLESLESNAPEATITATS